MRRLLLSLIPMAAALVLVPAAHAAAPSCQRQGATLLAANGKTRVVSVPEKPRNSETRRVRLYGCWTATGRRFTLFEARDFGLDEIEHDTFTIVDGRYIGALRDFEGGASESKSAETFDALKHKKLYESASCDAVDQGDTSGIDEVTFLRNGAMAFSCQSLHLVNQQGDKVLEPQGTPVTDLASSFAKVYWTVAGVAKSFTL
jgi:hypothetical protein